MAHLAGSFMMRTGKTAMRTSSVALAATASLVLTACGGPSDPAQETAGEAGGDGEGLTQVNVGVIPITDVAPIYLGIEQGFFEDEGLELELTPAQGGAAIVPGVVSGDLDFGFSNVTSMLIARSQGLPIQIVANGNSSTGDREEDFAAVMVGKDSNVQEITDLEGARIAVNTLNNISDNTISAAVAEAGGDPATIDYVEMPFPDMGAALEKGNVDGIAAVEPFMTLAEQNGARPVLSNYAYPVDDLTVAVWFTTEQTVQQDPETVDAFSAAMQRSLKYADSNPDEVRKILPEYTELAPDLIEQLTLPRYPAEVNRNSVEELAELAVTNGMIEEVPDLEALIPRE
jgi:NitT/TauT family transport system substrate-binding protein